MDQINNEITSIEHSPNVTTEIVKDDKVNEYTIDQTHQSEWELCFGLLAFIIFTGIVITIGVIIVCVTISKKTNETCESIFRRSAQPTDRYNSRPYHVAVADFDRDGYLDLVIANSGSNNIGVLLNHGNGTFASQILYSTGHESRPYSVAVGDFDNDTILDVVVANYGINSVGVFLGYGNGTFRDQQLTSLNSSRPLSIAIGDFDHDNILDIAVANYGTMTIAILLGFNNGSFRIDKMYDMGYDSNPYSLAIDDINKDKQSDIIVVNYGTSEVVILLNNGNWNFTMETYSTGSGSHPSDLAIDHFNDDKYLDIAVANSGSSSVAIFLGNENGSFTKLMIDLTGSHPQSLVVSDFNKDTQLDIAVVDSRNNSVYILKGYGNGSFSHILSYSTGQDSDPSSIAVGDFDNDGSPDIVITNNNTNNILILRSFIIYPSIIQANYSTESDSSPYSVDVADFNEDNYLDVVVPNSDGDNVGVFINRGDGTFRNQDSYYMGESSRPFFVATGDFNNDNHFDIVVVLNVFETVGILLGDGNGTFTYGNMYSTGYYSVPYTVAVGDFDKDGNLDLITSNYNTGNVGIFFGYGDGTFQDMIPLLSDINYYPKCVGVGDFNNDDKPDIAASNAYTGGGIAILLGYGNGSFQEPLLTSTKGDLPNCFTIGDLNDDRRSDIVYTDTLYSHVGVLLGSGNGTFDNLIQYLNSRGSKPWFVALGYYDNNDFLDIAVSSAFDSSINIFLGIGDGSFEKPNTLMTGYGSWPWSVMFGDFNNDNQQDIVVANDKTNNILIFFIHYSVNFANETSYRTGSGPHPYSVSVSDLNHDGQSDIVVTNIGNNNIELLLNYNDGIFMNRTILSTGDGSHPQSVTIGDFNKDQLLDIAVVNGWTNDMNVFIRLDDGSFDTKNVYSTGSGSVPNSIISGDFNKDGRMDVVIANKGIDNLAVFLAFDYITYTENLIYIPGFLPVPYAVATGDFNNDNQIDIAVANLDAYNIGIYLGYGNGSFSEQIPLSTGYSSSPFSLAVGDFNNDNYLDIVVANPGTDNIGVFLGYGNGSFQLQIPYSTGYSSAPISVAIGDFNNDSRLDIVVANFGNDIIYVFQGYGNGTFTRKRIYWPFDITEPVSIAVADLNNDNILDIAIANYYANNICILFGYGDGNFGDEILLSTGDDSAPIGIAIGDFNKDNLFDIAVANSKSYSIGIFFGGHNKTFSSQKILSTNLNFDLCSIVVRDVNNDTIFDIIVSDYNTHNSSVGIYFGFGDGTFTLPKIYPTGLNSRPALLAVDDFNNDGKLDLAIPYRNKHIVSIMLQLSSEPFASSSQLLTGTQSQPKSVAVGDFNNDNQLDIIVANSGTNNLGIFLGYGDGTFRDQLTYDTGNNSSPNSVAVGHFNDDHYLDIAIINSASNSIGILLSYGNGTFKDIILYSTGFSSVPVSIAVNDLNKDNHTDLVVANSGTNNILVYFGTGNGSFLEPQFYSVGYNARPESVAIGYIDKNDKLDIIVANYGTDYVEILLQDC